MRRKAVRPSHLRVAERAGPAQQDVESSHRRRTALETITLSSPDVRLRHARVAGHLLPLVRRRHAAPVRESLHEANACWQRETGSGGMVGGAVGWQSVGLAGQAQANSKQASTSTSKAHPPGWRPAARRRRARGARAAPARSSAASWRPAGTPVRAAGEGRLGGRRQVAGGQSAAQDARSRRRATAAAHRYLRTWYKLRRTVCGLLMVASSSSGWILGRRYWHRRSARRAPGRLRCSGSVSDAEMCSPQ